MRTTVTLQEDVARAVDRLRRERGTGVSDVVNELVRRGLASEEAGERKRFEQRSSPMRARIDVTDVAEVLDTVEGPGSR